MSAPKSRPICAAQHRQSTHAGPHYKRNCYTARRTSHHFFPTSSQVQISSSLWITSLLQFLQKHNLQLAKGSKKVSAGPDEPLSDYLHRRGYPSQTLNIYTVSDAFNRQTLRWSPSIRHILQSAAPATPLPDLPDTLTPTSVRIGQLWHTNAAYLAEPFFQNVAPNGIVMDEQHSPYRYYDSAYTLPCYALNHL